ncbi:hypothetical protein JWK42_05340 [Staphylococcus epidermidis]|jgi:hypothetical protein|uniref:hypothetical protein n=1 Tax=Staphylococcus epidermidis TaxID=1282 RepID=UPI000243189F|nr:hypothetical protein [Staphylococcus epidermidis]EHM66004.1 hypothetical protein SEVCU071_1549 [Staphylococcus epidermidis VCU071]KAB2193927.1 hypothetical protein F9B42_04100 [Staphylococcus epidermidis]MBM0767150.1 hypothetical protein [Staphylococcus epidermidis]MBM0779660.1 hypothetical protein [Staphylococcus epidermidis]MBO0389213.1 hypothetical protein [Staphylococcus epidermidis]
MTEKFDLPYLNNNHIKQNILELFEFIKDEFGSNLSDSSSLKEKYFESVNKLQITKVPYNQKNIIISFSNEYLQNELLDLGMIDREDLVDNNHIYSEKEQEEIENRIQKALDLIKLLHKDLYELIEILVGSFLILKKRILVEVLFLIS